MKNILKSALLVSDSYLWGLWTYKALRKAEIDFEPILSDDIDETFKKKYRALFVPGGWSSNKFNGLGEEQRRIIKDFVQRGGLYLGICGGASLAGIDKLGITSVRRTNERVPSYSGPCRVNFDKKHPVFKNVNPVLFLWFPPELEILNSEVKILAKFQAPEREAYVSDLSLYDYVEHLDYFETSYGIRLNPQFMIGKPLIIEEVLGNGRILLSLVHFDTPNCHNGLKFLKNLVEYYKLSKTSRPLTLIPRKTTLQIEFKQKLDKCYKEAIQILNFGIRNFLFHKRYPYFYQWKRGIRGLELLNLIYLFKEMVYILNYAEIRKENFDFFAESCQCVEEMSERVLYALKMDYIKERGIWVKNLENLPTDVFGPNKKSYGGEYRALINLIEKILVRLWKDAYK